MVWLGGSLGLLRIIALARVPCRDDVGVLALGLEPAGDRGGVAVSLQDPLRTGGLNGVQQAGPVHVTGEHEPSIDRLSAPRAADPHPARGEAGGQGTRSE